MKKVSLMILVFFLTNIPLSIHAESHEKKIRYEHSSNINDKKDIFKMPHKPSTPTELLRNVKFALDNGLFLSEDFYTEENLLAFFGGKRVTWFDGGGATKEGQIGELGDVFENANRFSGEAITFRLSYSTKEGHGRKALIRIPGSSLDKQITADLVVKIFGEPTSTSNSPYMTRNLEHPSMLSPAIHKLGNMALSIPHHGNETTSFIDFVTMPAGQIRDISITQAGE